MADQIDSSIPQNSEPPTLGAQRIREFKADVNTLVGLEHDISDDGATQGFHGPNITIPEQATVETPPSNYGRIGVKEADGAAEAFYADDAGGKVQLTRGGKVNLDKNIIANDTPLQADNEAGDGLVDLIKAGRNEADDANVMVISDGSRTDTDAAPLEDTGVANKKYVDDQLISFAATSKGRFDAAGNLKAGSTNVASVVRNSTGNWTVTWTTPYSGSDYVTLITAYTDGFPKIVDIESQSTTAIEINMRNTNGDFRDGEGCSFTVIGN